jgi:hypothetical protein
MVLVPSIRALSSLQSDTEATELTLAAVFARVDGKRFRSPLQSVVVVVGKLRDCAMPSVIVC